MAVGSDRPKTVLRHAGKNVRMLMIIVEFSNDRSSMTVFMHIIVIQHFVIGQYM